MADRPKIARSLSDEPLKNANERDMAIYSFKALYTMGTDDDLLHFLPRIFDLAVESIINPSAEWNSHDTTWLQKVAMLREREAFTEDEFLHVIRLLDSMWILILLLDRKYWFRITEFLGAVDILQRM